MNPPPLNSPLLDQPTMSEPTTGAARQLLESLHSAGVEYCVWKGTQNLAEGLAGDDDLDVLVAEADHSRACEVLAHQGFVLAEPIHGLSNPGVSHFYGYDRSTEQFIHIHLYARLLTGESLVLTHWLPVERMLLAHRVREQGVAVASRSCELAVFVLRMMIKLGSLPELLWFGSRAEEMQQKLKTLLAAGADPITANELLAEHGIRLEPQLFAECVAALEHRAPLRRKLVLARRVRRQLARWQRWRGPGRLAQYLRLVFTRLCGTISGRRRRKYLVPGAVIALVGADATGKSTLISDVQQWLGEVFVVERAHVGKPPGTWLTFPINVLLPWARRLRSGGQTRDRMEYDPSQPTSWLQAIRAVALAWDRHRLVRRLHRRARAGAIVVCDRYTSCCPGAMDSPRLALSMNDSSRSFRGRGASLLARWESSLYRRNPPPDIVIKLHVPLELARERNALRNKSDKHSDADLVHRHRGFHLWQVPAASFTREISTVNSLEETRSLVRETIWQALGTRPNSVRQPRPSLP